MTTATEIARFEARMSEAAAKVRRHLALRSLVSGLTVGFFVAAAFAGAAYLCRQATLLRWAPAVGIVGIVLGAGSARRRRWSDGDVTLYLDAALGSREVVTSAFGLAHDRRRRGDEADRNEGVDGANGVLEAAIGALASPTPAPSYWMRAHAVLPIAVITVVVLQFVPLPPAPPLPPPSSLGLAPALPGLRKVEGLAALDGRDDAQAQRLHELAQRAAKLREETARGLETKEALARLGPIKDGLLEERLALGRGANQAGLAGAAARLREEPVTKDAARALERQDAAALDEALEHLANQRERADREAAKSALADAERAARAAGAGAVGDALAEAGKALDARGRRAEMLKDLASALEAEGKGSASTDTLKESLDRTGSDKSARALADALGEALEKLTDEERERLAKRLARASRRGGTSMDPDAAKKLAEDLASKDGKKRLEDALKELAKEQDESAEARRQRALDDALEGTDEAERSLGGAVPVPGGGENGAGAGGGGTAGASKGNGAGGNAGPGESGGQGGGAGGKSPGGGTVDHAGPAPSVLPDETMPARARPALQPGVAAESVPTFAPGQAGARATTAREGDVAAAAPKELSGIEKSAVPEAYRAQVRRYFKP